MTSAEITVEWMNQQLQEILDEQSKMYPLRPTDRSGRQGMIVLSHLVNGDSIDSIRVLVGMQRALDVGTIGRSIFESVMNMGLFLLLPAKEGVNRYHLFSSIEALRWHNDIVQQFKEFEALAGAISEAEDVRKWEADRKRYESDYGRPSASWSGKAAVDVCTFLDEELPPVGVQKHFFGVLYCKIYRQGSWAAHRTGQGLAGRVHIFTASNEDGEQVREVHSSEEAILADYFGSLLAFLASMRIVGRAFNIPWLEDYFQNKVGFLVSRRVSQPLT